MMEATGSRKGIRGRPPGEPKAVVRLPLPVATLARRLREGILRAGDINRFLDGREHDCVMTFSGKAVP